MFVSHLYVFFGEMWAKELKVMRFFGIFMCPELIFPSDLVGASLIAQLVKNLLAMQETPV